jgi:hypothetical protein
MTQIQGLKNFSINIKKTMLKISDARKGNKVAKLFPEEQSEILEFYLEVVDYLSKQGGA